MAEYFDPSPRASKRRKTTTYKIAKSVLDPNERGESANAADGGNLDQTAAPQEEFDSAYGSKEDSLLDDKLVDGDRAEGDSITTGWNKSIQDRGSIENPIPEQTRRSRKVREETPQNSAVESSQEVYEQDTAEQPRSSGRQRKRPTRYSISPEKPKQKSRVKLQKDSDLVRLSQTLKDAVRPAKEVVPGATPKGILTPSRREKRSAPRKSVLFDQEEKEIEEQLGFKDINSSLQRKSTASKARPDAISRSELDEGSLIPSVGSKLNPQSSSALQSESGLVVETDLDGDDAIFNGLGATDKIVDLGDNNTDELSIDEEPETLAIKASVLTHLMSNNNPVSSHLQSQYESVYSLLRATVVAGESNSLLLLGARGAGKSQLLGATVSRLHEEHANDFHVVRLNGFYQTDDRVALREIWRQLGREMQIDEDEIGETGGSYADTMASLLSLLSHPDEFSEPVSVEDQAMDIDSRTVKTSKSIVFILDEFDLFTTHPRQTLLYNLFDIAQSKKAPIAVVGCSTRMDVVDCLEKRVKSRFSHRWLHVPLAKSLGDIEDIVKSALCVREHDNATRMKLSKKAIEARERWNEYIQVRDASIEDLRWKCELTHTQTHFLTSPHVQSLIRRTFYTTKSVPNLYSALFQMVATVRLSVSEYHTSKSKQNVLTTSRPTSLSLLTDMPTLHLALLIASSRLDTIHNLTTLNFNLVYAHYQELLSRSKLQITASGAVAVGGSLRQWGPDTARSAWEDLGLYGCIVPASGMNTGMGTGSGSRDGASASIDSAGGEGADVRMWRVDVILEEIDWAVKEKWKESGGVRDILSKWCREI